jgi:hypothetical protein
MSPSNPGNTTSVMPKQFARPSSKITVRTTRTTPPPITHADFIVNRLRYVPHPVSIVKRGMKSLSLHPWDDLKNNPRCKWFKLLPVPSFAKGKAAYDAPRSSTSKTAAWVQTHALQDERPHYRSHHSLSPPPSSSRVSREPEVYAHRHHDDHSELSSPSSDSSRTLVESDYTYEYEDDYSGTSSSTSTYHNPPPPLRSEKHGHGLGRSSRSDSDGSRSYSERRRGCRIIVEL